MKSSRTIFGILKADRGDTLVEVTIALAILASVLSAAYVVANRAYILSQRSQERSVLINEAQQQAEALKVFRDTHTWYEFENGGVYNGVSYGGVSVRYASPVYDCESGLPGVQPCFRMVRKPFGAEYQWVPVQGPSSFDDTSSQIPGTYYVISGYPYTSGGCINAVICRDSYDFYLSYGATAAGQSYGDFGAGTERASMAIKLQNLETLQP